MTGVLTFQDPLAAVVEGDATQLRRALWAFVCTAIKNKQSVSCLAWTRLQERADYSHRSEMTKHNLNPLQWKLNCPGSTSDSCKHHPRGKCCNYVHCKKRRSNWASGVASCQHCEQMSECLESFFCFKALWVFRQIKLHLTEMAGVRGSETVSCTSCGSTHYQLCKHTH